MSSANYTPPQTPRPWKMSWVGLLPSAVLVAVALSQIVMAWQSDLSPWKGGGFGMFSTIESPSSRLLRIRLTTNDGVFPVPLPDRYRKLASEIRTRPTQEKVDQLAAALAAGTWTYYHLHPVQEEYFLQRNRYFPPIPQNPDTLTRILHAEQLNRLLGEMSWITLSSADAHDDNALKVLEVEVSCMQMSFDQSTSRLVLTSKVISRHRNSDH